MNWLRDHVYVATWLGLVGTVILAILQARKTDFAEIDWFRLIIYFSFFTALGVIFTPTFDQFARNHRPVGLDSVETYQHRRSAEREVPD